MKKFNEIDEEFICDNCNKKVDKLIYSSRDHCKYCLYSKHLDISPGDRASNCFGILVPIDVEKYKDTYKIIYRCSKCGKQKKNIIAKDDDFDQLLYIMSKKA